MKRLLLITLLLSSIIVSAQPSPYTVWQATVGACQSDVATDIIATDDGYVVSGYTNSKTAGSSDMWIFKFNKNGKLLWEKTIGGRKYEQTEAMISTADGSYLIVGETMSKGNGDFDVLIANISASGKTIWEKTYGCKNAEYASSIVRASDGGYIIAGHTSSKGKGKLDYWIFKIDKNGNKKWEKTYGHAGDDLTTSIVKTTDGGYLVAGNTEAANGSYSVWLLNLDKSGNMNWSRNIDGGIVNSIANSTDGGFVMSGNTPSMDGTDIWLVRLDEKAEVLWQRYFSSGANDYSTKVINTFDDSYIVTGYSEIADKAYDMVVIKYDRIGGVEWEKTFGGAEDDRAISIVNTAEGSYALAGWTKSDGAGNSDAMVIRFSGYLFNLTDCLKGKLDSLKPLTRPREEGEKWNKYNKRLKKYVKARAGIVEKCWERYQKQSHKEITESYKRIKTEIVKLSDYNADKAQYKVLVIDRWHPLYMNADEAKQFKENWEQTTVEGLRRLSPNLEDFEYINLIIKDPKTGNVFPIGFQIKAGQDPTLKEYEKQSAKDSLQEPPLRVKPKTDEIYGKGYEMPVVEKDLWQCELKDFERWGMAECLKTKLLIHKDLLKPKGEFETTKEYEKRMAEYKRLKENAEAECRKEKEEARQKKIADSYQWVSFKIDEISKYNEDRNEFNVKVNNKWYRVVVNPGDVENFKANWKNFEVKGIKRLKYNLNDYEYINLNIYDLESGKKYPIGIQEKTSNNEALREFLKE